MSFKALLFAIVALTAIGSFTDYKKKMHDLTALPQFPCTPTCGPQ